MNKQTTTGNWAVTAAAVALILIPVALFIRWFMVFTQHPELSAQGKLNLYEYALPAFMQGRPAQMVIMVVIPMVSIVLSLGRRAVKGFPERMVNLATVVVAAVMVLLTMYSII
jgi:hypothetical protein